MRLHWNFRILSLAAALALATCAALFLGGSARAATSSVTLPQAHVTSFDWTPTSGTLHAGESADISVHYDQPVFVSGNPIIFIGVNCVDVNPFDWENCDAPPAFADIANYASGSGTSTLTFHWAPKSDLHGTVWLRGIIDDGGAASIKNADGADAEPHLVWHGGIYTNTGLTVDTPASVSSVDVPADGTYTAGDNLDVVVHFSSPVTVSGGPPRVNLFFAGGFRKADYHSGSGTAEITFRYTVQDGDLDADGITLGTVVFMNAGAAGGMITDGHGFVPDLNLRNVPATSGILVDAQAPQITAFTAATPAVVADTLHYRLAFDEGVQGLNAGSFDFDGTGDVDFYELHVDPVGVDGRVWDLYVDQLTGSGTLTVAFRPLARRFPITDAAGNAIDLGPSDAATATVPAPPDTTAPAFSGYGWSTNSGDGHVYRGETLTLTMSWDEAVEVTGTPRLPLTLGSRTVHASFDHLSADGKTAYFTYTVAADDNDVSPVVGPLDLNGGSIKDAAGNDAASGGTQTLTDTVVVGTPRPSGGNPDPTPTPTPPPAPKPVDPGPVSPSDTVPPTKPARPQAKVSGRKLAVSSPGSTDNVGVVGYRVYQGSKLLATFDSANFKLPVTLSKPGRLVLQLKAFDAAGNESASLTLTLTRAKAPTTEHPIPAWAWKLARWQDTPKAKRGARPETPQTLPAWYAKWYAWHKQPVKVTVG